MVSTSKSRRGVDELKIEPTFQYGWKTDRLDGYHSNPVAASDLLPCTAQLQRFFSYLLHCFQSQEEFYDKCPLPKGYIQGDVMQESCTLNANYMLFALFRILKSNFKGMKTKNSDL